MFDITRIEYYVKPEKNKVVAIIRGVEFDAAEELMRKTNCGAVLAPGRKYIMMPHLLKATAYCHPDDTFDEKKGRQIAKKRLMKMYNNTKASTISQFLARIKVFYDSGTKIQEEIRQRAEVIDIYSDL